LSHSYSELLADVTCQLVDLLTSEDLDPRRTDGEVEVVLRAIGLQLTQFLLRRAAQEAVAKWTGDPALNGGGYRWQRSTSIRVMTLYGAVSLLSPYLTLEGGGPGGGSGVRPVFEELDLKGRSRTVTLERRMVDFGIDVSYDRAASKLREHYGLDLSGEAVRRVTVEHSTRAYVDDRMVELDGMFPPRALLQGKGARGPFLVEMDGSAVRTGELQPAAADTRTPVRGLPKRTRTTEWRDTRLAFIRPLHERDDREYTGGIEPYEDTLHRLRARALLKGWRSGVETVCVSDGAKGLMERMTEVFEGASHILDRPHLVGHLHEVAAARGLQADEAGDWVAELMEQIGQGDVARVIAMLDKVTDQGRERAAQCARYLERFKDSVSYALFRDKGLPIGSGEIESAHKSEVQSRFKIPGATWRVDTVNTLLAMRLVRTNGRWDTYWETAFAA